MGGSYRRRQRERPVHTGLVNTIRDAGGADKATAYCVYDASDPEATKALYAWLATIGPAGLVAMELFRAHKASSRAKEYRGRATRDAYAKKNWAIGNLCDILAEHAEGLGLTWGWGVDEKRPANTWVLYVDLPTGQVSFHAPYRMGGPLYDGQWDRIERVGEFRICAYIGSLHDGSTPERIDRPTLNVTIVASRPYTPAPDVVPTKVEVVGATQPELDL